MPWNETDLGVLRSLADAGMSPKQIREQLGNRYSVGAIAGKVWRYTQSTSPMRSPMPSPRPRLGRPKVQPALPPAPAPVSVQASPPVAPLSVPPRKLVSFLKLLDNGCRWPVTGTGLATMYCGAPTLRMPYCDSCRCLGTEKPSRRDVKPKALNRSMTFNT